MTLQTVPAYIGEVGYLHPAELDRNILESIFGRTGLCKYGDLALTPTGVNQQVSIAPGGAVLVGSESSTQGAYYAWNNAAETKTFGTPSAGARVDALLLRVVDKQYGSDPGLSRAEWDIVAGTSGVTTARPDSDFNSGGGFYKPGAWFRVADVRIDPGDTVIPGNKITHNLRYTRASQGGILCQSTARPTDAVLGDTAFEVDTKQQIWWDGTAWSYLPPTELRHRLTTNYTNATTSMSTVFTFTSVANAVYDLEIFMFAQGGDGADGINSRIQMTVPASSTGRLGLVNQEMITGGDVTSPGDIDLSAGSTMDLNNYTSNQRYTYHFRGTLVTAGNGGAVNFQLRKIVTTGSITSTVYAQSQLIAKRIA